MWWHGVCEILALLGILSVVWRAFASYYSSVTSKDGRAPIVPGYPVIGNTLSLAQHGAAYIHRCRMQVDLISPHTLQAVHGRQEFTDNQGNIAPFACSASCKAISMTMSGSFAYAIHMLPPPSWQAHGTYSG